MLTNAITRAGGRGPFLPKNGQAGPKELDQVAVPHRQRITVHRTESDDIEPLLRVAAVAMGTDLAPKSVVARVAAVHPDALWTFMRDRQIVGGVALLMLSDEGLAALLGDTLDLQNPFNRFLSLPDAVPAGIYIWALVGASVAAEGIARVMARMQAPPYDRADFYALPLTKHGLRFSERMGFRRVPNHPRDLYRYVRLGNRQAEGAPACGR